MTRHYLDHASTSPLRPGVAEAMAPWLGAADPGRVHTEGRMARMALEDARDRIAAALGCRSSREVVLTSGATEAVAMATWGATRRTPGGAVLAAAVEHSCVREWAARAGGGVVEPPVDGEGRIQLSDPAALAELALVNVQWGNHEVGALQPVDEVVAAARHAAVLVHVDAAQAVGRVAFAFGASGADLASVSAHKLGGPRGVGALLVRRGLRLEPLLVGGAQERLRRAGLENVAGAVGFAAALEADPVAEGARQWTLTERLLDEGAAVDGVVRYTPDDRLPHIACFGLDGVEAEPVLLGLDQEGVAVHSGSSCSSELLEPSPVLQAMGVDGDRSLRASVGWTTTDEDVTAFLDALPRVLANLRALRP